MKLKRSCSSFQFNLPRFVPEFGELGYFTKYPSPLTLGTNLGNLKRGWCPLLKYPDMYPSLVDSGTSKVPEPTKLGYKYGYLKRGHQPLFKLPRFVPEVSGLGYFVTYPSPRSSGTNLGRIKKRGYVHTISSFEIHPAWYPRLVGSSTSQSTRAHQAREPSWMNFKRGFMIWHWAVHFSKEAI